MEMSKDTGVVLDFVRDDGFAALWRACCERTIPWKRFEREACKERQSPEELYTVITALKRRLAFDLPFDNYVLDASGPGNWFFITSEMHDQITALVSQSRCGSELEIYLQTYVTAQSRLTLLIDEYLSLARRDGMALRSETVRSIWSKMKTPETPEELLAANFASVMRRIEKYQKRKISYGLIEELFEALTEDVEFPDKAPVGRPRIHQRKPSPLDDPEYALLKVAEMAEGRDAAQAIHPVFRSMLISGVFWEFFPFPFANSILEMILRNLFYRKEGLPVLAWLSFSRISEQWEQGTLVEPEVICQYLEPALDCGEGFDATSHFGTELQLMLYELEFLREKLESMYSEDKSIRSILENERYLNSRQRDVLLFSLHNPGCQFSVADHKNAYRVVYATARQDLVDLVDMGFMSQYKQGRAFIYEATPRFFEFVKAKKKEQGC